MLYTFVHIRKVTLDVFPNDEPDRLCPSKQKEIEGNCICTRLKDLKGIDANWTMHSAVDNKASFRVKNYVRGSYQVSPS